MKTLTAKNSSTGDQVTKYVYGTTTSDSGVARNDLLRAVIYPDSDDTEILGNGSDGTYDRVEIKYNRLGQLIERKDQNTTVHAYDYDKLGRATQDRVTAFGTGVDNAIKRISRTYEMRGMLAKLASYDHATAGQGAVLNDVQESYNTFGQLTTEHQQHDAAVNTSTSPKVQYGYADGSSSFNQIRATTLTYPNARAITYDYGTGGGMNDGGDELGRLHLPRWRQRCADRLPQPQVRLDLWGGTSGTYGGLDNFGRVTDQKWATFGGTIKDQFQYGYDRNSNRTSRDNTQTTNLDELYGYDSLDRLANMDRGTLAGGAIASPIKEQDWTLDPTGNWSGYVTKTGGTTDLNQSRAHNPANEIGTENKGDKNGVAVRIERAVSKTIAFPFLSENGLRPRCCPRSFCIRPTLFAAMETM